MVDGRTFLAPEREAHAQAEPGATPTDSRVYERRPSFPRPDLIERERKFLLTRQSHDLLSKYLTKRYQSVRTEQTNFYLDDELGVFSRLAVTVRIRRERCEAGSGRSTVDRLVATLKGRSGHPTDGVVEREEIDHPLVDVGVDLSSTNLPDERVFDSRSFARVRWLLWSRFSDELMAAATSAGMAGRFDADSIRFRCLAVMQNTRLRAELLSGVVFELDNFETGAGSYYELEVESERSQDELVRQCVEDVFDTLSIPVVCDPDYPSKQAVTYLDAGLSVVDGPSDWPAVRDRVARALGVASPS